ncbi:MAG TPA: DUF3108 domain-containing protein [Candidatus Angelobacter sp.]
MAPIPMAQSMKSGVILLLLVLCQPARLFAQSTAEAVARLREVTVDPRTVVQAQKTSPNSVGVPKPAVDLTAGTWKYKVTAVQPDGTYHDTYSITVKDDGAVWTVTSTWETPGPVTDVQTLEKGTLILRKESFKHFAKPGRPWSRTTNLDFTGSKVTGATNISGQDKPVAIDLGGPLFAGAAASELTIGCLPLADGYSTTFRNFDIQEQKESLLQLKVVGMERVTVPAGTFDSYKVELTSASDRRSYKGTVWIAKDSRTPVKASGSETVGRGTIFTTTELVP